MINNLDKIYSEYCDKYKLHFRNFKPEYLKKLIAKVKTEAEKDYKAFSSPKICRKKIYIAHRVREYLEEYLASKTLRKLNYEKPQDLFEKSLSAYLREMPSELSEKIYQKLFEKKLEERKKFWESLDLPMDDLQEKFIDLAISRKISIEEKYETPFLDFYLKNFKIPRKQFDLFMEEIDRIIEHSNSQFIKYPINTKEFYSVFGDHCLLCLLPGFPFNTLKEVKKYMFRRYRKLNRFRQKINIVISDKNFTIYNSKNDSFDVYINNNFNIRHQSLSLIHELGHVLSYLENFENDIDLLGKGKYQAESEAYEVEFNELKNLGSSLYDAKLVDFLLVFRRILFELEIYKNPNQNLSKLYAQTFNRCLKEAKQKENPLYILDNQMVLKPFNSLPHAVAAVKVLKELLLSRQRFSDLRFPDNSP